jgi:hypothetical protein
MIEQQRQALAQIRFNSVEAPDDVWLPSAYHVDGLHERAEKRLRAGIQDAKRSKGTSPIGLSLQGRKGVGKTHLLGTVRRAVQAEGGYFFLVEVSTGPAFWEDVAEALRGDLLRPADDGTLPLVALLDRLAAAAGLPPATADALAGRTEVHRDQVEALLTALKRVSPQVARESSDVLRALVLYAADDSTVSQVGQDYLSGSVEQPDDGTTPIRGTWGLPAAAASHRAIVSGLSRVLALTGPSVIAVDQLDSLVDEASLAAAGSRIDDPDLEQEIVLIAGGLMQLRDATRRTLSVVSCLPSTWNLLHAVATDTVVDRFTNTPILGSITSPDLARSLIAKWLDVVYKPMLFTPPHPTWPVAPAAFDPPWRQITPRQLLQRIQQHAEVCLDGPIRELATFDKRPEPPPEPDPRPDDRSADVAEPAYFADLDRQFAELRAGADVEAALDEATGEVIMPSLVHAGLSTWITEFGNDDTSWGTEPQPDGGPLHAVLRRTVNEEQDVIERWLFRCIVPQHGNKIIRKVREARSAAGVRPGGRNRHLVLIHHGPKGWTGGKTKLEVDALEQLGSPRLDVTADDIRTLWALREMTATQNYELLRWLVARRPASRTSIVRAILPPAAGGGGGHRAGGGWGDLVAGGGVAQARGGVRRVGGREDGAAAADRGGVRVARGVGDRAGPEQRPGPAG